MHKNMFRLKNGAIVEIRGVPGDQSSIRIKASHLAEVFGVQNIRAVLQSKSTGKYQRGIDFWTLAVPMSTSSFGGHRSCLFVSYACMVQLALCTRVDKGAAEQFKKWVLDVACIAQTGTQQQREQLASSIVEGIPLTTALNHYKSTSANPGAVQVLYLILMGQVGLLRESLNIQTPDIPDDWVVLKVGKSEDYCSWIRRHERGIGTLPGVLLSEVCVAYMDHLDGAQLCTAETRVKHDMWGYGDEPGLGIHLDIGTDVDGKSEIMALDPRLLRSARNLYNKVRLEYAAGAMQESERVIGTLCMEMEHQAELHLKEQEVLRVQRDASCREKVLMEEKVVLMAELLTVYRK